MNGRAGGVGWSNLQTHNLPVAASDDETRPPAGDGGETGHADRPVGAAYSAHRPLCACAASCTVFSGGAWNGARFSAERRATLPVR